MPVAGIDVGSLSTEVVILHEGKIAAAVMLPTGANSKTAASRAMEQALTQSGFSLDDLDSVVATGYGRVSVPFAHAKVTEITCHGRGAYFLDPDVRTVIDIGGQDSKVICLNKQGKVVDFLMNDKCAAGTGRFLEVMCQALEVGLADFSRLALSTMETVPISSMCTVFAESEVISLIAEGYPREQIIRGITLSIVERTEAMAGRIGVVEKVMMTGGVAKNRGVVEALQNALGVRIALPEDPQLVGALGAALLAQDGRQGS